jgi:hypothetical protein
VSSTELLFPWLESLLKDVSQDTGNALHKSRRCIFMSALTYLVQVVFASLQYFHNNVQQKRLI